MIDDSNLNGPRAERDNERARARTVAPVSLLDVELPAWLRACCRTIDPQRSAG
jgi:hypothetical protein